MSNTLTISNYFKAPAVQQTFSQLLGSPEKAAPYIASIVNEVRKSVGTKNDLTTCKPESIVNACIDAVKMELAVDGRQHAHLIKRGDGVNLQIGYRGYAHRINTRLENPIIITDVVYQGEDIDVIQDGSKAKVIHKKGNPFTTQRTTNRIVGAYAMIEWGSQDSRMSTCTVMDRAEIDKIKGKAQTQYIWNEWFEEKAKVAVLRRACKVHFAGLTKDLDDYDNQNYDLTRDQHVKEATNTILDEIESNENVK